MTRDRRIPEAGALRKLFREQWARVCALQAGSDPEQPDDGEPATALDDAVDGIVEGTSPAVRAVGGHRRRLRASARAVLDHVTEVVARMPAPLPISRRTFASDPKVNAFFASPAAIEETCGSDRRLQALFQACPGAGDVACFSLLMTRTEREVLGVAQGAGRSIRDVRQTTVSFEAHRVLAVATDEDGARRALRRHLFDGVVGHVRRHMRRHATGASTTGIPARRARMSPEAYLGELTSVLARPRALLRLDEDFLVVSRLGVKLDDDHARANALRLQAVAIGDQPAQVVVLATYPRGEMRADAQELDRVRALLAASAVPGAGGRF